jgi:transcription initiation factor IIE alpha subunit
MTPFQKMTSNRVAAILRAEIGLRDDEIAERLDLPLAELRPILRAMYWSHRIDRCWAYTVAPPGRRAA